MLYGQMIEHAYWSVHMGLCSQMLDNGGFELDRDGGHTKIAQGWRIVTTDTGNVFYSHVDDETPYNGKHCQKITVYRYTGGAVRLAQNYLSVENGKSYKGFVMLKGTCGKVVIKLLSVTQRVIGRQDVDVTQNWKKAQFTLDSAETDSAAAFAIEMISEGTLFLDQAFLYPAESYGGVRPDIAALYKELEAPFLRWPGGSYLIWHHWKHAIGPLEDRPYNDGRILRDWNFGVYHDGEWDSNAFGTDEFMAFCHSLNTEPMVNVNIKDGLQNTLDWIEYCNGGVNTTWGAERARNGHPEPYAVKYWVIDNEPLVHTENKAYSMETFPTNTQIWAEAMKRKDPSITIMCMGDHDLYNYIDHEPEFSEIVARATKDTIDHLCVHIYYDQSFSGPLQGMPYQMGVAFGRLKKMLDKHSGRNAKVFLSEWNPESNTNMGGNMGQALESAQLFHVMERASAAGVMDFATPCQLCVNVDKYRGFWLRAALVQISNNASWTSPLYHVNRLYAKHRLPNLLQTDFDNTITQQSVAFNGYAFPSVDLVAAASDDMSKITLKIVNNSDSEDFEFHFKIHNFHLSDAVQHTVSSNSILNMNSRFTPDHISETTASLTKEADGGVICSISKNSVILLELNAE
jgi:alpha-N-arabinofuranosidase